jgi:hypothetical protein
LRMACIWPRRKHVTPSSASIDISSGPLELSAASRCGCLNRPLVSGVAFRQFGGFSLCPNLLLRAGSRWPLPSRTPRSQRSPPRGASLARRNVTTPLAKFRRVICGTDACESFSRCGLVSVRGPRRPAGTEMSRIVYYGRASRRIEAQKARARVRSDPTQTQRSRGSTPIAHPRFARPPMRSCPF